MKVLDQYDYGNNDWIAMDNNPNEWAVAYHGTSESAVKPICEAGGKFFTAFPLFFVSLNIVFIHLEIFSPRLFPHKILILE